EDDQLGVERIDRLATTRGVRARAEEPGLREAIGEAAWKRGGGGEPRIDDAEDGPMQSPERALHRIEEAAEELRVRAVVDVRGREGPKRRLGGARVAVVAGTGEDGVRARVAAVIVEDAAVGVGERGAHLATVTKQGVARRREPRDHGRDDHEPLFEL